MTTYPAVSTGTSKKASRKTQSGSRIPLQRRRPKAQSSAQRSTLSDKMTTYLDRPLRPEQRYILQLKPNPPSHRNERRYRKSNRTSICNKHGMVIVSDLSSSLNEREDSTHNRKSAEYREQHAYGSACQSLR